MNQESIYDLSQYYVNNSNNNVNNNASRNPYIASKPNRDMLPKDIILPISPNRNTPVSPIRNVTVSPARNTVQNTTVINTPISPIKNYITVTPNSNNIPSVNTIMNSNISNVKSTSPISNTSVKPLTTVTMVDTLPGANTVLNVIKPTPVNIGTNKGVNTSVRPITNTVQNPSFSSTYTMGANRSSYYNTDTTATYDTNKNTNVYTKHVDITTSRNVTNLPTSSNVNITTSRNTTNLPTSSNVRSSHIVAASNPSVKTFIKTTPNHDFNLEMGNFRILPYSEKSIVLTSQTKEDIFPYIDYLKKMNGKFNRNLRDNMVGWIFKPNQFEDLRNLVISINNGELQPTNVEEKHTKKEKIINVNNKQAANNGYQVIRTIFPLEGETINLYVVYDNNNVDMWPGIVTSVEINDENVADEFTLLVGEEYYHFILKGSKWIIDNVEIPHHYIERPN